MRAAKKPHTQHPGEPPMQLPRHPKTTGRGSSRSPPPGGPDDHVVTWHRPQRPQWMDKATYASMPVTLTVRELRVPITTPGCRTPEILLFSTFQLPTRRMVAMLLAKASDNHILGP